MYISSKVKNPVFFYKGSTSDYYRRLIEHNNNLNVFTSNKGPCVLNMCYVYIIKSEKSGIFYKGSTSDYYRRLIEHNNNLNVFTSNKGPWELIFVQEFVSKKEALTQEKKLKRCTKEYLNWLIKQPVNILNHLDR